MQKRPFDIIVYGATGFTGKLVAEYLLEHYGLKNDLFNWAIAGRNLKKLEKLINSELASKIHKSIIENNDGEINYLFKSLEEFIIK